MHIITRCLAHIDDRLTYLNPPLPSSPEQWELWTTYRPLQQPPLFPKWNPPLADGGSCNSNDCFLLNEQTECFQRGYISVTLYDELMELFADGFHHNVKSMTIGLRDIPYDFIIVIRAQTAEGKEVAAACMVELRCSAEKDTIPYLFIFELVTKSSYGRHGLAQQMVHAVDTLAFLMTRCSQINPTSVWNNSLNGKRLFMGLTVDLTEEIDYWKSLVRLYSRCGMYARRNDTPGFEYKSFSPYADASYDIEIYPNHYLAMYKEAMPNIVYSDETTSIAVVSNEDRTKYTQSFTTFYYHILDTGKLDQIKQKGLTSPTHACLHYNDATAYIAPDRLIFYRRRPAAGSVVFTVLATSNADLFEIHSSIPNWFAAFIGKIEEEMTGLLV